MYRSKMLQTQDLRVDQINEPCIRLIQENLIKNFVQDRLPYIPQTTCLYTITLAYPK